MTTDLNWLPLSLRKNIVLPKVVWEEKNDQPYGGFYEKGILTIVEDKYEASVIAHEFKHYLQDITVGIPCVPFNMELFRGDTYNKAIRLFFRTRPWEMEALLFQHKYAPEEYTEFWLHELILPERI